MNVAISKNAHVDPRAELEPDVEIGPFCVVGPGAVIGRGTRLSNNVTIDGRVTIGRHCRVFAGAAIGGEPQDLSYQGGDTQVVIGDNNVIREGVTINRASEKEDGVTSVGNNCYLMACCHVGHDCHVGDNVVIANGTLLAGHTHIHDHATLSGAVAVHQYATIGEYSFVSGLSRVNRDVPPYMLVEGSPMWPRCVNVVALRRSEFMPEVIDALADAHRLIYRSKVGLDHAREWLRNEGKLYPAVNHLISFIDGQHEGRHGRTRERRRAA